MTNELSNWNDFKNKYKWHGILIGNGASRAVWDKFNYQSLYSKAKNIRHPLTKEDIAIFEYIETENFETILSALKDAEIICKVLKQHTSTSKIKKHYRNIKNALVYSVREVHIPYKNIESKLLEINKELRKYTFIYSTNYDLIIYWARMKNYKNFKDYFFSGEKFDVTDTDVGDKDIKLLFLHGALHLYRLQNGETLKRKSEKYGKKLLQLFGTPYKRGARPLVVSEGKSKDKLASISKSNYLSFAYSQFKKHKGNLVIFGHSLNKKSDKHIIDVINKWEPRKIAISLWSEDSDDIDSQQVHFRNVLKNGQSELFFYNAKTHPLGSPSLKVKQPKSPST